MNSYVRGAIAMAFVAVLLPFEFGCENRANETGIAPLDPVSDAPKTQAEFQQRNVEMLKNAQKGKSASTKTLRRN